MTVTVYPERNGWMTGEPPCWYSGDHTHRGSARCVECGKHARCYCGRFLRADFSCARDAEHEKDWPDDD